MHHLLLVASALLCSLVLADPTLLPDLAERMNRIDALSKEIADTKAKVLAVDDGAAYVVLSARAKQVAELERLSGQLNDRIKMTCTPLQKEFEGLNRITSEIRHRVGTAGGVHSIPGSVADRMQVQRKKELDLIQLENAEKRYDEVFPLVHKCNNDLILGFEELDIRVRSVRAELTDRQSHDEM